MSLTRTSRTHTRSVPERMVIMDRADVSSVGLLPDRSHLRLSLCRLGWDSGILHGVSEKMLSVLLQDGTLGEVS